MGKELFVNQLVVSVLNAVGDLLTPYATLQNLLSSTIRFSTCQYIREKIQRIASNLEDRSFSALARHPSTTLPLYITIVLWKLEMNIGLLRQSLCQHGINIRDGSLTREMRHFILLQSMNL
jgi:hypothetical protein